MFVATHSNEIFAIVRDAHSAELVANALNVYFNALLQHQAEQQAAEGAAAAAANDSNVFDAGLPAGEVDAVTGAPIESVGQPSDIEQLPSL